jgi:hypothetical protein
MPGCPEAVNSAFSVLQFQPARAQFQTRTADAQKNAIDPSQAIVRGGKNGKDSEFYAHAHAMYGRPRRCLFVLFVCIRPWTGSAVV